MKRYSTTVIAHICVIVLLSAAAFFAFSHRMPFTGILLALFIAGLGINLYRLQMIQLRLMKQLSQNIRCGDTALSFRSKYRNAQLEELTDELREAMRMYKKRTMEIGGYDRHCRDLSPEEVEKNLAAGIPFVIRQKMPLSGHTTYVDAVFGEIGCDNAEMQDQILIKADGYPTYNFCHVIDDYLMGVTHVVRGSEYLTSTPKYVLLYDAFGWERPIYVHLPLMMGKDAEGNVSKLSKRHGAVSFADLVADGYLPEAIINYIALLGWCPKGENSETEFFTLDGLRAAFDIAGINKSPAVFDYDKLLWFNGEYIKNLSDEDYLTKVASFLKSDIPAHIKREKMLLLLRGRISKLSEIDEKIGFFLSLPEYDASLFANKKNKVTPDGAKEILAAALPVLSALEDFSNDSLYTALLSLAESLGVKSGAVMWSLRIAVAGLAVTPGGATEIMEVLGKEETLARLAIAMEK